MTDNENIIKALIGRAPSPEKAQALTVLFQELVAAYEQGATKAVVGAAQKKLMPLRSNFETAYSDLQKKMGL